MLRIKELRLQRKKTQGDIATALNINRTTYAKWETGDRLPDMETLNKLADYFNVTTDYILRRTDNPEPPETVITNALKDMRATLRHVGLDGLTRDEVDKVAEYARFLKSQRK